jgi:ABC-2 type transport system permease protein
MNFTRISALVARNIILTYRGLDPLVDLFYWPLFDLILWGFTSKVVAAIHGSDVSLIWLTGMVLWQACWRSNLDVSLNFLIELWSRNVVGLFATPLITNEWIAASMLQGLFDTVVVTVFASIAVYVLYGINVFTIGFLFIPLFFLLLVSGWALGFFSAGCLVYGGQKVQKLVWVLGWFFVPFSALFYPLASLPTWAFVIAKSIPMSYAFEALRIYVTDHVLSVHNLLMAFLLSCFYFILSLLFFRYMFKKSKEKGLARLEAE